MKTHKVIDIISDSEDNNIFVGTKDECYSWVNNNGMVGYKVVLLNFIEFNIINKINIQCDFN